VADVPGGVSPNRADEFNKKFWEELFAYFPWYDTGLIENDASNNSSIVACYRDNVSTQPLPSNDRGVFTELLPSNDKAMHIQTQRLMGGIFLTRPLRWAQVPW
jgi:hypothetical protein